MKIYNYTANIEFEAENIDEAWKKLRNHYQKLLKGRAEHELKWFTGEMHCLVVATKEDNNGSSKE